MINMSQRIRKIRRQKGLTQAGLGVRIGVSQRAVTNYERGIREPSLETPLRIAGALQISLEELVGEKPPRLHDKTSRAQQKRLDQVKTLPPEKQKAFIAFVDALTA
jgi:transcriptional regulator with XRE-family HTH domain